MNPRIAIVGAGPAGAFTASQLIRNGDRFDIDIIERLPTPWGLLRAGVAPDHGEIKVLDETFERTVFNKGCRFFGNVSVGEDVSHSELMRRYHAVVYAVGAQTDKSLGIPGEELAGSMPATAFVGWYNGHPDHRDLAPDLSSDTAVVIGNGNVAADVARLLTRDPDELARTDVADHALAALRESARPPGRRARPARPRAGGVHERRAARAEPHGRRRRRRRPRRGRARPRLRGVARGGGHVHRAAQRRAPAGVRRAAERDPSARKTIELRFLRSPVAIHGTDRVEVDRRSSRNELYRDERGALRARAASEETETIPCGLVLRSVGYRAVPLPDVPFDERAYVLPNERGPRAEPGDRASRCRGVYAVGWIKRGPTGILGTNKRDAEETVGAIVEDLAHGRARRARRGGRRRGAAGGPRRRRDASGWSAIDRAEVAAGEAGERPRVKLAAREELLQVATERT